MGGIEKATYDILSKKGWKHQVLTTGSWTAPISGVYFLNGVGAGAAGRAGADSTDRPGGGSGESAAMLPVYLSAGTVVSAAIGGGGVGDGGSGGDTTFGSYLVLRGGGASGLPGNNFYGGGLFVPGTTGAVHDLTRTHVLNQKPGANAVSAAGTTGTYSEFAHGTKSGTYMWGGAGSKYAAGGAGNSGGAGLAGGIGAGGGSGTTTAGSGGDGYLEIMWQE